MGFEIVSSIKLKKSTTMYPKGKIIIKDKYFDSSNFNNIALEMDLSQQWVKEVYDFLCNWYNNKPTIEVETSGSTGTPKKIELKKEYMRASAIRTLNFLQLNANSKFLLCLPARYIAGKMMIVRALEGGHSIYIQEPNLRPFEKINVSIDFAALTPMQLNASIEDIAQSPQMQLIVGGAPINNVLANKIMHLNNKIFETYGMTETCTHIALRKICPQPTEKHFVLMEGVEIDIDKRNCLTISCKHLGIKHMITNDIVEIKQNNSFTWVGRYDNIINSGGVKISPEKVETTLSKSINVPFFIAALPHNQLFEQVVLFVEIGKTDSSAFEQQIKIALEELETYQRPKKILFCEMFIYNNQKIMRNETIREFIKKNPNIAYE